MFNITNHQGMQIKPMMKYYLTHISMAITNKLRNNCW